MLKIRELMPRWLVPPGDLQLMISRWSQTIMKVDLREIGLCLIMLTF